MPVAQRPSRRAVPLLPSRKSDHVGAKQNEPPAQTRTAYRALRALATVMFPAGMLEQLRNTGCSPGVQSRRFRIPFGRNVQNACEDGFTHGSAAPIAGERAVYNHADGTCQGAPMPRVPGSSSPWNSGIRWHNEELLQNRI